eukprot:1255855-Alexandrium_andersonii.AAC.1
MLRAWELRLREASPNTRMAHSAQGGIGVSQDKEPLALDTEPSQHLDGLTPPVLNSPVAVPRMESVQGTHKH